MWERAWKWGRRRPAAAALVLVSGLAVVSMVAGGLWYNARLSEALGLANRNLDRARQAVDEMLTEVAQKELTDEPRMDEKRRKLLTKARKYYQEFLKEKSDDPAMKETTAQASIHLADISRLLEEYGPAEEAYQQAIDLLKPLVVGASARPEHRQQLAYSFNWLGEVLRAKGNHDAAAQAYTEAKDLQEALVREVPDNPDYQQELARTFYNLGIILAENRPPDAQEAYERSIAILRRIGREHRNVPAHQLDLVRGCLDLGIIQHNTGQRQEAARSYSEAKEQAEALVKMYPTQPDYSYELAKCCNNLGNLLRDLGQFAEAKREHRQAFDLLTRLVADFPNRTRIRGELANTYNSLGIVLVGLGSDEKPDQAWEAARDLYSKLMVERPNVPDYRAGRGRALGNLGLYQLRHGQPQRARASLEEGIDHLEQVLRSGSPTIDYLDTLCNQYWHLADTLTQLGQKASSDQAAQDYFLAARCLAKAVPWIRKKANLTESQRHQVAEKYADRAMKLLADAVAHGYKKLDKLTNGEFAPLEQRPDFQRLLGSKSGSQAR
jgi:tetratricopeptide (TPR) repeat protein